MDDNSDWDWRLSLEPRKFCLAGVDLVESKGFTHSTGTVKHEKMVQGSGRFSSVESVGVHEEQNETQGSMLVDTLDGQKASSQKNWQIYARAIENLATKLHEVEFFQLSSSACVLNGITRSERSVNLLLQGETLKDVIESETDSTV